jgi:hypothetical protein
MRLALWLGLLIAAPALADYSAIEVVNGGTIRGRISYAGKAPAPRKLRISKDPKVCGETRDEDVFIIGAEGGVRNVVVYLTDARSGKPMAEVSPRLDQKGCRYEPHVQVVPIHSTVRVTSSDPIFHNVHSFLNGGTVINFAMPPQRGLVLSKTLDKPGGEQLKCDVHNFMTGGIFVAENPYYALTAADGTYEIDDVPPGTYTIATWHQAAGLLSQAIVVTAGAVTNFDGRIK